MGEILGQLFVKEYFKPETKERYEKLVENVVASFREHIQKLDWMSDSTKQKALVKLEQNHAESRLPRQVERLLLPEN